MFKTGANENESLKNFAVFAKIEKRGFVSTLAGSNVILLAVIICDHAMLHYASA
jgi:hypothetical protein